MFPAPENYVNRSPNTRSLSPFPERERSEPLSYFNSISYPNGDFFPVAPSSSPVGDEIQIPEALFFDIENPAPLPSAKCNQSVQTDETINSTKEPKAPISEKPEFPKSCQNSIVINIGTAPQPGSTTTMPQVISNPSQPSVNGQPQNDGGAPPAIPLPTLPTPSGISIPPPPQETDGTANAQQQASASGNKQGCCACACCKGINKTYLIYSLIAVCASLTIALVPSLVTILVKNNG